MAEIRPFRGVRYDSSRFSDPAAVISPPYDIISPQQQDELYQRSQYNFVRIEFNRETPQDHPGDSRYTRAAAYIDNWLKEGVLRQDETAAFYLHAHSFICQGRRYLRRDIIAAVKLEEWETRIVRPHENIIPRAKSDRMSMLYACRGNTSQVLAMYADPQKVIANVLQQQEKEKPLVDFTDPWGEEHQLWAIVRPELVQAIETEISQQPLYIADGHHRYDSALTCRREQAARDPRSTGREGYNYVMTSLIDFADSGMVILPTHRLVKGLNETTLGTLKEQLGAWFDIREIPVKNAAGWLEVDSCLSGLTPAMAQVSLAIFGLTPDCVTLLTVRDFKLTGPLMPAQHSDLYRKLDVSLVDHVILENLLGYDKDKDDIVIAYTHERREAIERVQNREYQISFLLNPVDSEIIKEIADAGDRMPRKSTYFYPKAPAGLVFYQW